jgi:hypothetical protein
MRLRARELPNSCKSIDNYHQVPCLNPVELEKVWRRRGDLFLSRVATVAQVQSISRQIILPL